MQAEITTFHGLPCVRLSRGNAQALVSLHGGQLLSWIPADGRERLFLSECAVFDGATAIRGGVPVIFPQFGARGALLKHGFARLLEWRFAGLQEATPFGESAVFELEDDEHTRSLWPVRFGARLFRRRVMKSGPQGAGKDGLIARFMGRGGKAPA